MNLAELQSKTNEELLTLAVETGADENGSTPRRQDLLMKVLRAYADEEGHILATCILSIVNGAAGFLRQSCSHPSTPGVYVS